MLIIGYSGHAFVVCGILHAAGKKVRAYCDTKEKAINPFRLEYLGKETDPAATDTIKKEGFFIAIGDNTIRRKIYRHFEENNLYPVNAIHPTAIIDAGATLGKYGIMVSAGVCINPLAAIGNGAICNTGCIIEHECVVGEFSHIGPGAVLCGNVTVGEGTFIGASSVIRQGISIGKNAMVGAGSVIIKNLQDNEVVAGNPARVIRGDKIL